MRTLITTKQTLFFAQNGYIELGGRFSNPFPEIHKGPPPSYLRGRDLWREAPILQHILLKELAPTLFALSPTSLRLALDQWIPKGTLFKEKSSFDKLFSMQGLRIGVFFAADIPTTLPHSSLGLSPYPQEMGNLLFVKPNLLINWPVITDESATDLYFAAFAADNALYIHNANDPLTYSLKTFGYQFGDRLENRTHPLLTRPR